MMRPRLLVIAAGVAAIAVASVLALRFVSPGRPSPSVDPAKTLHVVNDSARAVMVDVGGLAVLRDDGHRTSAVRACGGTLDLPVLPSDFEDDGRLLAGLLVDPTMAFDHALADYAGDPLQMPGEFQASIFWSDGRLGGRLPVTLTIAPDLTVTVGASAAAAAPAGCVPAS